MIKAILVVTTAAALVGVAVLNRSDSPAPAATSATASLGVDQLHMRRSANGHMLDLRYRIVDPVRARSLLTKEATAYVVHARSGRRLGVPDTPKTGALRSRGVARAGRTYFALFADPIGIVRPGDRVKVVLGDLSTDLTVE